MSAQHTANRREDMRLITGKGRYTSDLNLPGQLFGYFVRSDRPHAEIASVDTSAAANVPGVRAILTGADALSAGYTQFQNILTVPGKNGQTILRPERPVLAAKRVRHVGDALALVVADTAAAAQDAAEAISVEYRDLPAVVELVRQDVQQDPAGADASLRAVPRQPHDALRGQFLVRDLREEEARERAVLVEESADVLDRVGARR